MKRFFVLVRFKEWVKNIIVFAPLFFSTSMFDWNLIIDSALAFIAFCLLSGSVYIINDISDLEHDKQHPVKKNRPLAKGDVGIKSAIVFAIILLLFALSLSLFLNQKVLIVLLSYFGINLLYSFWLKKIALIDIVIISIGFVLRLLAGAFSTGIILSDWILLLTLLLSVFLVLGKRRQDLVLSKSEDFILRKSFDGYSEKYIDLSLIIVASVIIVTYLMYSISPEVSVRLSNDYFKLTSVWIILAFLRYFQLIYVFGKSESPINIFFKDTFLMSIVTLWMFSCFYFIYL